jgi:glutamate 5-kinase
MTERDPERALRDRLSRCRSIVLKIGSKSLAGDAWHRMAEQVAALRSAKKQVTIVSSGAIALGVQRLGLGARPKDMAWLQAAAAAGQSTLMRRWEDAFEPRGLTAAQVLLTHADLADRTRANNARAALDALLSAGVVPIINENDAVAVDEIRFGDNDQLASMVVPIVGADLLLLLSDVEGLLDADGARISYVPRISEVRALAGGSRSGVGTGGMVSKLEAARRASLAGAHVVIAPAKRDGVVRSVLDGDDVGTIFPAAHRRLHARKHWIAFTLRPRGTLVLDRGAIEAVHRNKSVLPVGVLGIRGSFVPGDCVSLADPEGREVARGLVRLSSSDAARAAGKRDEAKGELVHRDDLVLLSDEATPPLV